MLPKNSPLYKDYRRYIATGSDTSWIDVYFFTQGFWATAVYRFSRWVRNEVKTPGLRQFLKFVSRVWRLRIEMTTSIRLPAGAEIGPGLYIGYFGPIILHPDTKMGSNCNLSQGVTIGIVQRGERAGVPTIGDRVYIGPNAVIIGGITIGNDVAIGAGAIVTKSVPDRAVVAGNPAKILSYKGSFEMITYDGMDDDPDRNASLALRDSDN